MIVKRKAIETRIRNNGLSTLAGESFRDGESSLVKRLQINEKVFVGIENERFYTAIGEKNVFFRDEGNKENKIPISLFLNILTESALEGGKSYEFEFIEIEGNQRVWVRNSQVLMAFWNLLLLIAGNTVE